MSATKSHHTKSKSVGGGDVQIYVELLTSNGAEGKENDFEGTRLKRFRRIASVKDSKVDRKRTQSRVTK